MTKLVTEGTLSGLLSKIKQALANKSDVGHTHSYNDLTDKPEIPTADVTKSYVDTELAKKADLNHTHSYNDLTDTPTIPVVDVTKAYVDEELAKKMNTADYTFTTDEDIETLWENATAS